MKAGERSQRVVPLSLRWVLSYEELSIGWSDSA
jgi:hypothetical protein